MKKNKKNKIDFVDDGRTFYDTNVEGLPKKSPKSKKIILSNKERIALIKAIFIRYLPLLFGVIACFAVAMLLIYLWLN